ncbi:unnamed protein product [Linum trigynum]|uniref:CCHC-type domain-containing protein n=1 Tax=Linum trigynum TaxID=586398 RepID=A0AAV2CRC5_9ROSI
MDRAWEGRPWQISENTLQLKPWDENIRPQYINFDLADYWIQVHGILDHKRSINNIESAVAMFPKIPQIDMRGLNPERYMEFVRVFVQVDLNRPLPPGSYCTTDGVRDWLGFRYEKLYILCYYCGRQGHVKQECQKRRGDMAAVLASPPEGRYTPWMKAGTRAERPPPPPRGRIIHHSPGDAGSSSGSPGFMHNQIWVPGRDSLMTGSVKLGSPASPSEGQAGLGIRSPSGFTPHPFLTGGSSLSPSLHTRINDQRLHAPSPSQNLVIYGTIPRFYPSDLPNSPNHDLPLARNLTAEMEASSQWARGLHYQAGQQSGPNKAHFLPNASLAQANQQTVSEMVFDLSKKMDLNLKPIEVDYSSYEKQIEEGQAEFKKRKHGQPLDFEGPYFSSGNGPNKPHNARIRVKGRKVQHTQVKEDEGHLEEPGDEEYSQGNNSEAPVAGLKRPGRK